MHFSIVGNFTKKNHSTYRISEIIFPIKIAFIFIPLVLSAMPISPSEHVKGVVLLYVGHITEILLAFCFFWIFVLSERSIGIHCIFAAHNPTRRCCLDLILLVEIQYHVHKADLFQHLHKDPKLPNSQMFFLSRVD